MTDSELFDHYLVEFQPDLKKIIGKFKGLNHKFTHDEMLSEANLHLIKYKDKIINFTDEGEEYSKFCEIGFKKAAYSYTRNLVGWSQSRLLKNSYVRKRVDYIHKTEDGEFSTFEHLCQTLPSDEEHAEFDSNSKHKYVLKLLTEYTQSLTPNELIIIEHLKQGKNQYTIASELGVTHQAVSIAVIKLVEKIKNYLKFDFNTDNSSNKITKGNDAINSLFSNSREYFSPKDSKDLISFVKKNYKKHSLEELTDIFGKGKFEKCQILGVLNFSSLGNHIKKKVPNQSKYTQEEVDLIIKMNNEGKFVEDIAEALQKNIRNISCKCASMIKNQLIKRCPERKPQKPKYNKKDSKKMLEMFKEGLTTKDVAEYFKADTRSIGIQRGKFCRKGLIGLSKKSERNKKCLLQKS